MTSRDILSNPWILGGFIVLVLGGFAWSLKRSLGTGKFELRGMILADRAIEPAKFWGCWFIEGVLTATILLFFVVLHLRYPLR